VGWGCCHTGPLCDNSRVRMPWCCTASVAGFGASVSPPMPACPTRFSACIIRARPVLLVGVPYFPWWWAPQPKQLRRVRQLWIQHEGPFAGLLGSLDPRTSPCFWQAYSSISRVAYSSRCVGLCSVGPYGSDRRSSVGGLGVRCSRRTRLLFGLVPGRVCARSGWGLVGSGSSVFRSGWVGGVWFLGSAGVWVRDTVAQYLRAFGKNCQIELENTESDLLTICVRIFCFGTGVQRR